MAKDNNGYQQPWEEIYLSMEHGEGSKKEAPAETNNEIDINQSQLPESFEKTTNFGKATVRKYLPFFFFLAAIFVLLIPGSTSLIFSLRCYNQCLYHHHAVYIFEIYGTLCLVVFIFIGVVHLKFRTNSKPLYGIITLILVLYIFTEFLFIMIMVNLETQENKDASGQADSKLNQDKKNCTSQMMSYLKAFITIVGLQICFETLFLIVGVKQGCRASDTDGSSVT